MPLRSPSTIAPANAPFKAFLSLATVSGSASCWAKNCLTIALALGSLEMAPIERAKLPKFLSLGSKATASAIPPAPNVISPCPALLSLVDFWNSPAILAPPLNKPEPPINIGRNWPIPCPILPAISLGSGKFQELSSTSLKALRVSSAPLAVPIARCLPKDATPSMKPPVGVSWSSGASIAARLLKFWSSTCWSSSSFLAAEALKRARFSWFLR